MTRLIFCFILMTASLKIVYSKEPTQAKCQDLPEAIASFGTAIHNGYLYVYGGHTGTTHSYSLSGHTKGFFRINLQKFETWEPLSSDSPLQGLALVADKTGVYRIGGMTARNKENEKEDLHSVAEVAKFDPDSQKWTALPPLPVPRSSHRAAMVDGKIYVFGGWTIDGDQTKATWPKGGLVLDLSASKPVWKEVDQPFRRRALDVVQFKGKIWVIGGLLAEGGISSRIDIFDPAKGTWTVGPNVPGPVANGNGIAAAAVGNHLFIGGMTGIVYSLSDSGEGWKQVGKMPTPRIHHRLEAINEEQLILVAGATRSGHLKDVTKLSVRDPR